MLAIVLGGLTGEFACTSEVPVLAGSEPGSDFGVPINASQLAALADGTLPNGDEVLAAWVRPFFACRSVVSRAELGQCAIGWRYVWPKGTEAGLRVQFSADTSVDDGPWSDVGPMVVISSPTGMRETSTSSSPRSLGDVLAGHLDQDQAKIRMRLVVHVDRTSNTSWDPAMGTSWTWLGEPFTVSIRDTFPPEYPRAVNGADVDERMRQLVATATASCPGIAQDDGTLFVTLTFPTDAQSAVPVAFVAQLDRPGEPGALGETSVAWSAGPLAPLPNATQSWHLRFERPAGDAASRWDAFVDDLRSHRVAKLHLAFAPSRAVAVQQPQFDEYWNASFGVDVAVGR